MGTFPPYRQPRPDYNARARATIEKVLNNYFPRGEKLRVEHATQEILKELKEQGLTFKEVM